MQSQIYRCKDLGVISTDQATRLWKECSRRGWKYKEPLDDDLLVEQPRLLRRAMQMLLDEKVQTQKDIFSALPIGLDDVCELTGMPVEAFTEPKETAVISLKAHNQTKRHQEDSPPSPTGANIFEFRQKRS
jgi:hypothetical protein